MQGASRWLWVCLEVMSLVCVGAQAQETPSMTEAPTTPLRQPEQTQAAGKAPESLPAPAEYNAAIFDKPIPPDQLEFIKEFDGAPSGKLFGDKRFRKLMKNFVPDCVFHYGKDMPLNDALDLVISGSMVPVRVRDGRFVTVSGLGGQYLAGRGFLWLDMKQGIGVGGFYFHPTNGEPTPSLVVFSRQVREKMMSYGALPQDFIMDMGEWSAESRVPFMLTNTSSLD